MIEAFCTSCGRDCTHANATYKGDVYCFSCLPSKPKERSGKWPERSKFAARGEKGK